jgi:integrase/recombinase XerD
VRLLEGVETYVERKRSGGLSYDKATSNLRGFSRQMGDVPLDRVTVQHVRDFLEGPRTSTTTWRKKHGILKHFFEFWASRGAMPLFLMPPIRPPCRQTFVPYIYTRAEIHTLLTAVRVSQSPVWCKIDAQTSVEVGT